MPLGMAIPLQQCSHRQLAATTKLQSHRHQSVLPSQLSASRRGRILQQRRPSILVRAEEAGNGAGGEDDFEARLAKLREAGGRTAYGKSRKDGEQNSTGASKPSTEPRKAYDFSQEKVHFESPPHRGDLAINIALGTTLLWLPLTVAAVTRAAFLKFRFTDLRVSVITEAPWKKEQLDAPYQEVKDIVTVPRGLGAWGDMVITLRNGNKMELRSLPRFKEMKQYILARRDALGQTAAKKNLSSKGFN